MAPEKPVVSEKSSGPDAATDFDIKAFEAAELKKKQEAEAKKAKEKDELDKKNAERAAALEASGKKAAGGLHKFDASEVDVHGGDATADDLMDAFGFGDDAGGDDDAAPAPAEGPTD